MQERDKVRLKARETQHTQDTDEETVTSNSKVTKLLGASHSLRQSNYHFETNEKTSCVAQKVILFIKEHNFYGPPMSKPLSAYMLEYGMYHGHKYNNTPNIQLNLFTSVSGQQHRTTVILLRRNKPV